MENHKNSALLQKPDRFKDLIERLHVITYEYDISKHRFIYVSSQAETMLGYPISEWMKERFWYNYLHPDDQKWAPDFSKEHLKHQKDHEFEYRMMAADGSIVWFKDITSVSSVNGKPESLQGVLVNITERKLTENELRKSKERYQALVEQQTEMITRCLPDGSFTYVNDVFCKFFGKERSEYLGRVFVPDMPEDDKLRFKEFFSKLSPQNPIGQFTHKVNMPDGNTRWLRWTDKAITDETGKIIEYQTVGRDITDRINSENALKRSEEHLHTIFENAPIGNMIANSEGNFIRVNKAICEILGYSNDELVNMNFRDITHPDDLNETLEKLNKTQINKQPGYSLEKRYVKKNGDPVTVILHLNIIYNKENEVEYYIGQVIDITEKKKYEAKLRDTELRLSSLFDNLQDVVFYESSAQGTFITDNVYEMLGYTGKELFENEGLFFSLIYPDDRDKVEEAYEKWRDINENACSNLEVRLRRKDGNYIWVEDRMFAVKTPERSYWAGFMIDITERKKSEIKLAETENRLSSILNNLSNIVFYENEDRLVFISDNIYEMLGYKSEDFYKNRDMFSSLVHPEDYNRVYNRIDEWFDKGEEGSIKSEFRLRKKDGSYIWVEDIMFTVITEQRKYWTGFFIDVSDRKQAAEKLRETNTRLTTIVKNLTNLTVYETGGGKNYISENIENLTGITVEKFLSDNKLFTELIHPADASHLNKKIRNWRKMGAKAVLNSEFRIIKENGECVWIEDHMFKVKNDKGEEYISGIMIDITEKKKAYEKIQDSEIRLSTILSNLPRIVIYQSGNGKNFISENISEMIGYAPEEILNEKYFFGNIIHPEDLPKVKNFLADWKKVNNRRDVLNMEYRLRKKDGDYIWIEDHMFEVNPPNQGSYLSGILIDMTERKMTEQKITQSLREKEILLKEIHHRVKNNLQVISSLLKLQSQYINDSQASNILLESQNRVRSMALVHQKLYQSEDFARVDFGDYVRQLTINLLNVYKLNNRHIKLNVKADDIFIGVDVAIPCGLIINELVSNSLKYAFNSHENGQIDITLNNGKNGCYNITVKDNGIGFPSNLNFRDTKSLGLQLVNTLVNQIEGKIEMETYKGTSFTISFNDASQNSLVITSN